MAHGAGLRTPSSSVLFFYNDEYKGLSIATNRADGKPLEDFSRIERSDELSAQCEMQYETLREEIANCTRMSNEFSTFSMTALAAVLAFAFSSDNPFLFLIPFVLIIPLSSKSLYYRKNVAKISAYMIVMLESEIAGYLWETLNERYKEEKSHSRFTVFRNYEYLFEALICIGLYLYYAIESSFDIVPLIVGGILGVAALVYVSIISYKMAHTGKLKAIAIRKWGQIRRELEEEEPDFSINGTTI